ncbi:MAG: porin, partial [Sulfuriferula sp.]
GMEEQTSARFINFQERSLAMNLVPAYDRGIQVHGAPLKGTTYALALSNGNLAANTLQNTTEPDKITDGKDVTGRATVNIAELMDIKDTVIHLGGAFSRGDVDGGGKTIKVGTEGKGATFFETKAFATGDKISVARNGVELGVSMGPVKFTSEYVKASYDGEVNNVAGSRDIDSWYAAINWNITGESYTPTYKGGKFGSRLKPNANFRPGAGWGAWEAGLRYSDFDASDFAGQVATASGATKATAWTTGLKWIVNPNTRFLLNYVKTDFNGVKVGGADSERAITMRGQFDF